MNGPITGQVCCWTTTLGTFPNNNNSCNYFRDVVFTAVAPTITSFTPSNGGPGTVVTITGANLNGATAVAFGGTAAASFTVTNDTTISATLGSGATGTIAVTTPGGTATSTATFTIRPVITGFTPSNGGAGTVITITGTNFTGATAVTIGGTAAASFTVGSSTSLTATVGSGATGAITVTTPGGTATSSTSFTYITAPTITGFTPTSAGAGSW